MEDILYKPNMQSGISYLKLLLFQINYHFKYFKTKKTKDWI